MIQATRDDELTAGAGETIVVAGEYKNPGWVWASRVGPTGQATGGYRLCPANYFLFVQQPVQDTETPCVAPLPHLHTPQQQHHTQQHQQQHAAHSLATKLSAAPLQASMPSHWPSSSTVGAANVSGVFVPSRPGLSNKDLELSGTRASQEITAPFNGSPLGQRRHGVPSNLTSSTDLALSSGERE